MFYVQFTNCFLLLVGVFLSCLSECKNWMLGRRKEISSVCSVSEDGASPAHGSCAGHAGGAVGRACTGHGPGPGVGHAAGPHAVEGRGGGGLLVHAGGHSAGGAVAAAGHVDLVDGLLDDDLTLLHILDLLAAGAGGREHALTGSAKENIHIDIGMYVVVFLLNNLSYKLFLL